MCTEGGTREPRRAELRLPSMASLLQIWKYVNVSFVSCDGAQQKMVFNRGATEKNAPGSNIDLNYLITKVFPYVFDGKTQAGLDVTKGLSMSASINRSFYTQTRRKSSETMRRVIKRRVQFIIDHRRSLGNSR